MGVAQLSFRLAGMTALCLAVLVAPLDAVDRALVLTAFGLGIGFAAVRPGFDRQAVRIVGPAVLVLALVPGGTLWSLVDLLALAVLGFASFNQAGMSRAVPALGLPVATLAFRTGETLSPPLLLSWLVTVVVAVALGNRAIAIDNGETLGGGGRRGLVLGWGRFAQTIAAVVALAPLSLVLAGAVDRLLPDLVSASPRLGTLDGQPLTAHPGLTGGLDTGVPVSLSDEVVLRVRADRPLYWRGTTYDQWDGRRWTTSAAAAHISWAGEGVEIPPPGDTVGAPAATGLPSPIMVRQHFEVERSGLDTVLGGWRIESLWTTAGRASLADDGTIVVDEPFRSGATWTVDSSIVPATDDDLRRADPLLLPPTTPLVARFGREDDITPEVAELAAAVTADAPTTYDKVVALEEWIEDNIEYSRDITPLPAGSDAVHHLLFESRLGYCEQIGSALVVMLRSLGIPARLVVGYVPGEYDGATGHWLSRGTDAHAWAEVWFPGVGWHGFDPTAGVPSAADPPSVIDDHVATTMRWTLVALALVGTASIVAAVHRRRRGRPRDGAARLVAVQRRFDRCGLAVGCGWGSSMTLRDKGHDLVLAGLDPGPVLAAVGALERLWYVELERRGPDGVDLGPVNDAVAVVEALASTQEIGGGTSVAERSR
ncbi:MAG: transglutaminaseTgpA domain-containing protein [Acidimicrobiales bacterium]